MPAKNYKLRAGRSFKEEAPNPGFIPETTGSLKKKRFPNLSIFKNQIQNPWKSLPLVLNK